MNRCHAVARRAPGEDVAPAQGSRLHCITRGWLRYYGTQWVSEQIWLTIKLARIS